VAINPEADSFMTIFNGTLRVAIIGSGPSAFYAADALENAPLDIEIDMFERLPTPFGLVRGGVAPDHPKIKSVTRVYDKIARWPGFRFYGHVEYGRDLTHADLRRHYHAVIYATGAQTDRRMGIPGEDLIGSHAATEFVGWYNGHPDYQDLTFDLSVEAAAVIGNGNVAMDVARILARTPDELTATDIAEGALAALAASRITDIYVLGRRGPAQAAFTAPEIKELGELADAEVIVRPEDAALDPLSQAAIAEDKAAARIVSIVQGYVDQPRRGARRRIHLRFLVSPVELIGDEAGHVRAIKLVKNELYRADDGSLRPRPTDQTEILPVGLVFRSIGYKGVPLDGLPFDERAGVIPNQDGRVIDAAGAQQIGDYVAGWIKRGPTGIIGTNRPDSVATVEALLKDVAEGRINQPEAPTRAAVEDVLRARGIDWVTYSDWERLDALEQARGADGGRPRVKFTRIDEMLAALRQTEQR
jgi:ferredoxin--NADP+ reductase